nr:reverse transcriptase domain-containing protein [Tanacetum cinerariifolium]
VFFTKRGVTSITSSFDPEIVALKAETVEINKNLVKVLQINHQVKADTPNCETCGGPHSYNDCPATVGQTQNVYDTGAYQGGNSYQPQDEYRFIIEFRNLPSNTITNPKKDLKGITTRSGTVYQGPIIPTTSSSLPQVVERETKVTKDTVPPTNNGSTKDVQPPLSKLKLQYQILSPLLLPLLSPLLLPYSANYNDMMVNRIDVIDMAYEEYSQEVLGFSDVIASRNPTPYYDPIVSTSFPTLTPFGDSDFLLEEVDAFLAFENDPTSPEVDHSYYDTEGDILFLEAFLNDDPSFPPPTQGMYLPQIRKELKFVKLKMINLTQGLTSSSRIRILEGWRVCMDYRKLNEATCKGHFPLSFMDQMLERLAGNEYYCFLDGFLGYFQIPIDPKDQEKLHLHILTECLPTVACLLGCVMHRARSKGV